MSIIVAIMPNDITIDYGYSIYLSLVITFVPGMNYYSFFDYHEFISSEFLLPYSLGAVVIVIVMVAVAEEFEPICSFSVRTLLAPASRMPVLVTKALMSEILNRGTISSITARVTRTTSLFTSISS